METRISGKVATDTTSNIANPIMPISFVNWYYNNASVTVASLNSLLNQSIVNQICQNSWDCVHDYLIRVNSFTSQATSLGLQTFEQSRNVLGKVYI
jgi:hypothetical protein